MSSVKILTPRQLAVFDDGIKEDRFLLLDVRERIEYDAGHIPMAALKPLSQLDLWTNELDKNLAVIVYCRTGKRSQRCAELMISQGFREVYVLEGGYDAWNMSQSVR